jgi:hypothetical protein
MAKVYISLDELSVEDAVNVLSALQGSPATVKVDAKTDEPETDPADETAPTAQESAPEPQAGDAQAASV